MAIVATILAQVGLTPNQSSYNVTLSRAPAANSTLLAACWTRPSTGSQVPATVSGISGLSSAFAVIKQQNQGGLYHLQVARAQTGASPSGTVVTVDYGAGETRLFVNVFVIEYADADNYGTPESTSGSGGTASTPSLSAFSDAANNWTVMFTGAADNFAAFAQEAGWDGAAQINNAEDYALGYTWKVGQDLTPTAPLGSTQLWAAIALEVKQTVAAPSGLGSLLGHRRNHLVRT